MRPPQVRNVTDANRPGRHEAFTILDSDQTAELQRTSFDERCEVLATDARFGFGAAGVEELALEGKNGFHTLDPVLGNINDQCGLHPPVLDAVQYGDRAPRFLLTAFIHGLYAPKAAEKTGFSNQRPTATMVWMAIL